MARGIINSYKINAAIAITNSTTLVSTGLTFRLAAGQTRNVTYWVPITVGAAGGVRFQVVVPAGVTLFNLTSRIQNGVNSAQTATTQSASAVITNSLATAGTHWLEVRATITGGAAAGNVDFQIAQNTADALTLTVLAGGWAVATIL